MEGRDEDGKRGSDGNRNKVGGRKRKGIDRDHEQGIK